MTDHGAHEVDCADVVEAVYLYLDGELASSAIEDIKRHLDECSPCLREYGVEQEVRVLIARSCTESAPDTLRLAIQQRIDVARQQLADVRDPGLTFPTD